ncbi:MAG: transcriptional repressor LexA [Candidatus Omnitrophota bacterium]|jgi:repressor LexA|nr:MAG: transcriptional repressor LexA [Candidatus Omnitrophota bacterium]
MLTNDLTTKQQKVLEFIKNRIEEQNIPPTIREIAAEFGFSSTGTVRDYLNALQNKGYLKRASYKSRHIDLAKSNINKIPIIGTIAAGSPSLAYEDIQGYVDPYDLYLGRLSYNDVFALKVKGDSMVDAGILEDDIAIIKKQPLAHNNDIIAALLDNNEVTLKIFKNTGSHIYLEPANVNYQPIRKNFSVIGKLISLLRKYR